MATNVTRLTDTGNLLVNGTFDEFTGAPVIDGNVVLWLDAGQTASYSGTGSTWTDLSTNGLNGTLVNSPAFSSSPANILFNGSTQRVTFSANSAVQFLNTSPYTLEVWVYPTQLPPSLVYQGLIDRESNPGTGRDGWTLWLAGNAQSATNMTIGHERFGTGTNYGTSVSVSSASTLGVWQQIVTTYDSSTIKIYRNGVQLSSAGSIGNITNTTQTLGLASRGGAGSFLYGSISTTKIYNRALTAAEVLQNYNALAGRYGLAANTSGTAIQRTTTDTVLAEQFDEVTYNTASPTIINQFTYTENFDNVAWAKGATAITANAVAAPNNTTTADKFNLTATTSQFYLAQDTSLTSGVTYTQSIYAKAGEQTILQITPSTGFTYGTNYVNFNLSTGAIQTQVGSDVATITSAGDGWYRCTYTQAATTTIAGRMLFALTGGNAGRLPTFAGSANSGVYIWGAQITASSVPEIYQPIAAANTLVSTGMVQRVDSSGNMYVSNIFDEVTGF